MVMEDCTGCSCREGIASTSMPSRLRTEGPKPCKVQKIDQHEITSNIVPATINSVREIML